MNPYESRALLQQYLLFHYGSREDILPWDFGPDRGWAYPADCATLLARHVEGPERALDLGCAVGRSSFELARHAPHVLGIDFSHAFVNAANEVGKTGTCQVRRVDEGDHCTDLQLRLDPDIDRSRVRFRQGDACNLPADLGKFDAVLLANLLDRLPDPAVCLASLPKFVRADGAVLITSPYTWMDDYTPRENWLNRDAPASLDGIRRHLEPAFTLAHREDLPFLIREHARKYQWSVAEASVWIRELITDLSPRDNNAAAWEDRYRDRDTPWDKGGPSPGLVDWLSEHPATGQWLVPGCGRGHDVRALAEAGADALGIDLSATAVEEARADGIPAERADLFDLPADWAGRFDGIWEHTCFCAIHPERRDDYAAALHRVLKPGGIFLGIFFVAETDGIEGPPFKTRWQTVLDALAPRFEVETDWPPAHQYRKANERMLLARARRLNP